jgi:hypothetical protein
MGGDEAALFVAGLFRMYSRFGSPKKYAAYAGLVPWVQNSNETVRHGRITKRGPEELRTALVQTVIGLRRMMQRYEAMKPGKGSGKTIMATARKTAVIIRDMLTEDTAFDVGKMTDRGLEKKSSEMSISAGAEREKPAKRRNGEVKKPALSAENGKKPDNGLLAD